MNVYIPTHQRYTKQITYNNLPASVRKDTFLVVNSGERSRYDEKYQILEAPPEVKGISQIRQWILDTTICEKIVMLDDDLTFSKRRKDIPDRFENVSETELAIFFERMELLLNTYAHGTFLAREGANRVSPGVKYIGRAMRVLAFNRFRLRELEVRFTPGLVQDDFEITLQLLKKKEPNFIICDLVHNQTGSGTEGGASAYRSIETHNESVKRFAEMHPGYVKVVNKNTKVAWGGQPRLDVVVQWRKAYDYSFSSI